MNFGGKLPPSANGAKTKSITNQASIGMSRTKINYQARRKIASITLENGWTYCQVGLPGCMREAHVPAHRHERAWYYDKDDCLLWDSGQWVPSCHSCHHKLDNQMTKPAREEIFMKLRGEE